MQGTLVTAVPGSATPVPAASGVVTLIESGLSVETTAEGRFELTPIASREGTVVFSSGGLKKVTTLEALRAGPGRVTALGTVLLGANASVQGEVFLSNSTENAGTLAFSEGELGTAFSNQTGQFLLRDLPAGRATVAFVRAGYAPRVQQVELRSGERFVLEQVTLTPLPVGQVGSVSGLALLAGSDDASEISVTVDAVKVSTNAAGEYVFASLPIGVHSFVFEKPGFRSVVLQNRLVGAAALVLPTVTLVPGLTTARVASWNPRFDGGTAVDAGVDAGEDGGTDAGIDAGIDAGSMDGGGDGDAGADGGSGDAGNDAGSLQPVAVISPVAPRVLFSGMPLMLNGLSSSGTPALSRYSWSVDTGGARLPDGGAVVFSVNDSGVAWAPTLPLPAPPAVVSVSLQVTDLSGRISAPATVGFIVGERPLALFDAGSLPSQLYSNQSATIDATPSRDTVNSGIASRRWELSPGAPVTTSALDGGDTLSFTTQTISANQVLTVSHYVTNGLGFESLARSHTITLLAGAVPMPNGWGVATRGAFNVDGGIFVPLVATLDAGGNGPEYANPSNYSFSWVSVTDAGTPPRWVISNPNSANASVFLPVIEGAPVRFDFSVTATANVPLMPSSSTASLVILAHDRMPPRLLGHSVSAGLGSAMGMVMDFSEPMDDAPTGPLMNVGGLSTGVVVAPNGAHRTAGKLYRNNRLLVITRPPNTSELWNFRSSGTSDEIGNALPPVPSQDYVPELRWSPLYSIASGSPTIEPRPDALAKASATLTEHTVQVFGADGTSGFSVKTGVVSQCTTAPCAMTSSPVGSVASTSLTRPTVFSQPGLVFYQPQPGVVFVSDGGTGFSAMPTAPGQVFVDSAGTFTSIYASGSNLRLAELQNGAWDVANEVPVLDGGVTAGTTVVNAMIAGSGATRATCIAAVTGTSLRVLTRRGTGQFGVPLFNNPFITAHPVRQAWVVSASGSICQVAFLGTDDRASYIITGAGDFATTGNIQYLSSAFAISSMDMMVDQFPLAGVPGRWFAVVAAGQLDLYFVLQSTLALNSTTRVAPPAGAPSLNANPSCTAANPRLLQIEQAIVVVWQEQCAGQPWNVFMRELQ